MAKYWEEIIFTTGVPDQVWGLVCDGRSSCDILSTHDEETTWEKPSQILAEF